MIFYALEGSTYQFIFDVLDELIPLFPDGYFHLGGDEVVKCDGSSAPTAKPS